MKIAIISSVFLPIRCGLSNTIYNLSKNFIKQGHHVTVIIPYYPAYRSFPIEEYIDGVRLIRFLFPMENFFRRFGNNKFFKWIYVRELLTFPIVTLKFIRFLKKERFTIINMQFISCYTPSVLIAKMFVKFNLVVTLQGYSSHFLPFGNWFHRWIFKKALQKADFLTAISEYELDRACKIEPGVRYKCTVIPNGMDFKELEIEGLNNKRYLAAVQRPVNGLPCETKRKALKIEEPFILTIGSLYRLNGQDVLLMSFKDVLEKGYRCHLVIVGDGYERRYLENLAGLLGIKGKVDFFSGLNEAEVNKLVQGCLFYIRTSRQDPIRDIYPPVIEQKKKLLSTAGIDELGAGKNAIFVKGDIESLSQAIIALLNNERVGINSPEPKIEIKRDFIFSLGRFEHYKRFDLLIRAFKWIIEKGWAVNLFIGGEGRLLNDYEKLIASLGLEERVYFVGFLDRERVIKFYRGCLFFVASFENEPFGVVVLEAMAAGKPVIVPRTGAMPELIKDGSNGIMVEPGSERALADAMGRLLNDKSLRDKLGSEARCSVKEKYAWDNISENYLSKFRNLSNGILNEN